MLTGYTNGQGSGNVAVPEWNGQNRPWFTTVNPVGFVYGYMQPGFQINGNLLQWYVGYPGIYPNIKYICGIIDGKAFECGRLRLLPDRVGVSEPAAGAAPMVRSIATRPSPANRDPLRQRSYRDIGLGWDNPIVAYRCAAYCASDAGIAFNGASYTHRFYTEGRAWVDFWAFADAPAAVSSGVEIYNQQGRLVFTSKDKPAKVIGQLQPPAINYGESRQYNIGGVNQLAIIQNSATFGLRPGNSGAKTVWINAYCAKVTGNGTVQVINDIVQVTPPGYTGGTVFPSNNNYTLLETAGQ